MSAIDPYLIWLDIPPHERPANYYRLFSLRPLEADANVIAAAAERVIAHVSRYQQSEHAAACTQLLAELTAARDCLLDPMRKQAYDSGFGQGTPGSAPVPAERPIAGAPQIPQTAHHTGAGQPAAGQQGVGQPAERQITHSPPVPGTPMPSASAPVPGNTAPIATTPPITATPPTGHFGEQPLPSAAMPVGTQPITGATEGVAHSVQPIPVLPNVPQAAAVGETSLPQPAQAQPVQAQPVTAGAPVASTPQPTPPATVPHPPANQPPAWSQGQGTSEAATVIAGQGAAQPLPSSGRTNRSRQMRREQQAQSTYLMVGIAMALVVFFFGAVLLLAIYMGVQ